MPAWTASSTTFTVDTDMLGDKYLPVRPLVAGFVIDTLFYATIAFVVLFAPGGLRRVHRRRRGRCISCGYDRQGLALGAICPECGKELSIG